MTYGTQVQGTYTKGYYRYRQWQGENGSRSTEHNYTYYIKESMLVQLQYKPYPSYPTWLVGSMATFGPSLPQSGTDFTPSLVNKCVDKIWGDLTQSKFNAGVFSAEFRESYHMIIGMRHGIAKALLLMKKKRFTQAINVLLGARRNKLGDILTDAEKLGANHYMCWHFGIIPLLQDISALYEWMKRSYRIVKRVRRHSTYKDSSVINHSSGSSWHWQLFAYAEVRGEVAMTELSEWDCLGLTDPASVAWEAAKLSWLVDWFIPIGNFLSAANASHKTHGEQFFVTRHQHERLDSPTYPRVQTKGFDVNAFQYHANPGSMNSRSRYLSLPFLFPMIKNPLGDNLSHWITGAAFLRQVCK